MFIKASFILKCGKFPTREKIMDYGVYVYGKTNQ